MEIWRECCWLPSSSPSLFPLPGRLRDAPDDGLWPKILLCSSQAVPAVFWGPSAVFWGPLALPPDPAAVREFCPICSAACIKRWAHSLSTSPFMIFITRGGDSVADHVTSYFWRTRNARHGCRRGGGGGWQRDEFWGLRSEFSRPDFTRLPHQTVVFLQCKNDSSSDSSPLIQNKYDSRVFKMRY